ncbi:MAG TPA: histidine kinase, partial [Verrucomicrobium sp.]|nr:histidine kinase [Verrucomicrobium sp.]
AAWALLALTVTTAQAVKVPLTAVESTTTADARALSKTVDGVEAGLTGWAVPAQTDRTHSAVFRCNPPINRASLRLWLSFLSGHADSGFHEFAIAITRDAQPSLTGKWEPLSPTWFNSTEGELTRVDGRIRAVGDANNPVYRIDTASTPAGVTGFRIDVFPRPSVAGESLLTEFRVERQDVNTTNIALGCPVTSSNPVYTDQRPEFITDGLTGTMAHPQVPDLGEKFYFEVDLRRVATLDHISLRNRADGRATERLSRILLELYVDPPATGAKPVWSGRYRDDGSYPEPGQTGVVRAAAGSGPFRGRYLRISSRSSVAFSPQIAEVEVYESLVPTGVTVTAGNHHLPPANAYEIPGGAPWISFAIVHPKMPTPILLGRRWRISGYHNEWLPVPGTGVVESRSLPPGNYVFQASLRHTDLEWNDASLMVPFIVPLPFWERPVVRILAVLLAVVLASLMAWRLARRRMILKLAELEHRQELERERARIARDMHDVVGSRLTQLTVMHEIFAAEHPLSGDAGQKLQALGETARAAISELDEAVWAVNPRNDTLPSLANYLCHIATEYLRPLGIACRQEVPELWPEVPVLSHHRHELLLAFKEALQNVAKHSQATLVTITLSYQAPQFHVRLADNGRGLPDELSGPEKDGLANMEARLNGIGGKCQVKTGAEGGTVVDMQVPLRNR